MKKLIALLLAIVIISGCCVFGANASVISDSLREKLNGMTDGETALIYMHIRKPGLSNAEISTLAYERAGFSDEKKPHYSEDYDSVEIMSLIIKYERYEEEARRVIGLLGIPEDRVKEVSGSVVTAEMTKAEIEAATVLDEVESLALGGDPAVGEKLSPKLKEAVDSASQGAALRVTIYFDEDVKTIDDMPSWPDGGKAWSELAFFTEYHNFTLAVDLLGPEYIGKILDLADKYIDYPWFSFPYYWLMYCTCPGCAVVSVSVGDIPRIAADERVRRMECSDESFDKDRIYGIVDPDDYITVIISGNGSLGRIKSIAEMPSWPDKAAALVEHKAHLREMRELYYADWFAEVEPVIVMDYETLCGSAVVAVKPGDVEKIASRPSVIDVIFINNEFARPETGGSLPAKSDYLYEFDEAFGYNKEKFPEYEQLSVHRNADNQVDWVLYKVESAVTEPFAFYDIIANRVYERESLSDPFDSGYGIYDVKEDKFVPVNGETVSQYKDLARTFDQIGEGRLIGDIDGDNDLTVIDCTLIQRCATRIRDWPEDDVFVLGVLNGVLRYYSDFDRDGERDIVDATKLQRYVTKID